MDSPHREEISPAVVARHPSDARVKASSTTDNKPPTREQGDAVARSWLRKIRDEAGGGGRWGEQLHV